jgi:DNA-binding response OmpR family regulator
MPEKPKILVVDDDTSTLEIILMVLANAGYTVVIDSKAELNFLKDGSPPDLILLDNNLGDRTGVEICKELKQLEKTMHIPVIMVSAMEEVSKLASDACADDYLSKPFGIQPLLLKIETLLKKNSARLG